MATSFPNDNVLVLIEGTPPFVTSDQAKPLVDFITNDGNIRAVVYSALWDKELYVPQDPAKNRYTALDDTVRLLSASGRRVLLMEDVPEFSFAGSECAATNPSLPRKCSESIASGAFDYMTHFRELARINDRVTVVPVRQLFCTSRKCRMDPNGELLYRETNHLNTRGSEFVIGALAPTLRPHLEQGR